MKDGKAEFVKVGIIGIGSMGKGLVYQSHITPGIECVAVCDKDVEKCKDVLEWLHLSYRVVESLDALNKVISQGMIAICNDGRWISEAKKIDAVIEATNSIIPATEYAIAALEHHKHVILMNSEIDLIYGPLLLNIAVENGVVCTSCDGDQYGVMKHLIDDLVRWGFELVMVGNIKGFLDRYANPLTIIPEADKRNLDYRMCTSYTDGTKLNIEMAIIANAYGLATLVPGMHGPRIDQVQNVLNCFDFDRLWNGRTPFVDYILGAEPGGGVFAVGYCDNPYQKAMLSYYKMGNGPYYLFYRPYHLCHIEAMETVFNAVLHNDCLLVPRCGFKTNVYAYAKQDLPVGHRLDGIGGYMCYGKIENCADHETHAGIPICLAEDMVLKHAVMKDERICIEDVGFDSGRVDWQLYKKAMEQLIEEDHGEQRHAVMSKLFRKMFPVNKKDFTNTGFSIICSYNDYEKLEKYLIGSLRRQHSPYELLTIDNQKELYSSAAPILNQTAHQARYDYLMFVHQDVSLLSDTWLIDVKRKLSPLKHLGAVGVAGKTDQGILRASVIHGDPPTYVNPRNLRSPVEVQTLDGCLIIVPKKVFEKVPFDESHKGWYLYVAGYCLDLLRNGYRSYVIPDLVYHASTGPSNPIFYEEAVRHLLTRHNFSVETIHTTVGEWKTR